MARTVTLSSLRTRVRQRADMVNSSFVSDSELNEYINTSITELYDLLISEFEDYYVTSANLSIVANEPTAAIPSDFYKLAGIDVPVGSETISLRRFNFKDRNRTYLHNDIRSTRYRIQGSNVYFHPVPQSSVTGTIWYHPTFTDLSADDDTFDGINGWEEYVVIDAAIKCLRKEESDTGELLQDKLLLTKRIKEMAQNRDANDPETIHDAESENFIVWY